MTKSHALLLDNIAVPAAGDAELRFRITDYSYAPVSETGAVAYLRAWRQNARPDAHSHPLTIARARSDAQANEAAHQLRNELALCTAIDDTWALKPAGSVVGAGAVVLLYDDADILSLDKVAPHALTTACFIKLAPKLARVMQSMHANGLVHRNVNPACFFIGIDTAADEASHFRVKIGGFGLACTAPETAGDADVDGANAAAALLCGEPAYMSPEHSGRTQRAIDARSDLYSLGVIFYRLLTGHLPFGISGVDSDISEWIHFHIASEAVAPHLLSDAIPEMLSNIVMRLLEKNPDRRYQDAAQLHADLEYCKHLLSALSKDSCSGGGGSDLPAASLLPAPLCGADPVPLLTTSAAAQAKNRMHEAVLHYHAGDYAQAGACLAAVAESQHLSELHAEFHFFSALILAAGGAAPAQKEQQRHVLTQHCEKIFFPSVASTPVLSVQTTILLGEIARLNLDTGTALRHYEQAASRAEENQLWHYAGIAHELAARVCQEQSLPTSLSAHLKSARRAYKKFDAPELAAQLARRFSGFPEAMAALPRSQDTQPLPETANIRDLDSAIRAARALSEEIRLDELMQTIMSVTLEHVGAERGLLIRLDEQVPYIDAFARTTTSGITVNLRHAPVTENDMPLVMLSKALNTGHQVYAGDDGVLQTFQPGLNSRNGQAHTARFNAICVPMLKQARVVGALYLENRVLPDAFTVEHTQILQLLASQAAISLETARLYAALLAENVQRKTAEKALRSSQTSLVQGEQFNHIGSMRYVLEEGLMYCSAELCRIYELEAGKDVITYEEFSALLHPDDRDSVLDTVETAVAVGGVIRVEHRICRKSGEVRYISGIGKPFYVDGKFSEYVGTATDITSRRQAEDALRVAQADLARVSRATTVGQLTASIAHEINQPLMSIVSNAGASLRWLDRTPMHLENARAGLHDIVAEGQRAGDMIQSLQRLTRNTEPVFERINLNAAIRHILAISRSEIERHGISLVLNLTQENLHVRGDFVQIQQVLLNLVINAVDAMAEIATRARMLSISSANTGGNGDGSGDGSGEFIRVIIADTGEGIAADATERVFEAFYTTKKNGMGMGLAICRSIIETHRGRLQAAVRQPYGSTFSFELPLAPAPAQPPTPTPAQAK